MTKILCPNCKEFDKPRFFCEFCGGTGLVNKELLSECCGAPMLSGIQCEACGSDGKLARDEKDQLLQEETSRDEMLSNI